MSKKICCVCGRIIENNEAYYSVAFDTYVCMYDNCFESYRWNKLNTQFVEDSKHRFVVMGNRLYEIDRESGGMGGRKYSIQFQDGFKTTTTSLWFIGVIPKTYRNIFKNNAIIYRVEV